MYMVMSLVLAFFKLVNKHCVSVNSAENISDADAERACG